MRKIHPSIMVLSFFIISCSPSRTTINTAKTMDIYGEGVIHKTVIVDLDVKEVKVTGIAIFDETSQLEVVKQAAVADALKKSTSDVLVEPVFNTEIANGKITCTVTGFPATYKNFRPLKVEDVPLLKVGITQKATVYEPTAAAVSPKKKSKAGLIVGGLIVAGAIVAGVISGGGL